MYNYNKFIKYGIYIDEGSVTYSNLKKNQEQLLTITASTCNGETVSKNFTFASRYSELPSWYDFKLLKCKHS